MKTVNRLFVSVMIILSVFLVGCQAIPQNTETINVAGHADMSVEPDQAKVYVGISILNKTASGAQAEADRVINAIIDGLRYKGIAESDIETENLNLYEDNQWVEKDSRMKTVGWRATQTLKVKTSDLSKVGDIVDVAVTNGANQINAIEFYLSTSKDDEAKQLVLAEATKNAKNKAQTMADNLGVKLDKIVSVSESNYGYTPYRYAMASDVGSAVVKESATVMPRDVTVSADMTLIYAVKQ